jgi:hypothetical protein
MKLSTTILVALSCIATLEAGFAQRSPQMTSQPIVAGSESVNSKPGPPQGQPNQTANIKKVPVLQASASEVVRAIGDSCPDVSLKALGKEIVIIPSKIGSQDQPEKAVEICKQVIAAMDQHIFSEGHVVQLWNNREADLFATAFKDVIPGVTPIAIGKNLLVIPSVDDDQKAKEIKRMVSLADLPRAQVDLHLLSAQISSSNADATAKMARKIESIVQSYNYELGAALDRGWSKVEKLERPDFDPQFYDYIANRLILDPKGSDGKSFICSDKNGADVDNLWDHGAAEYCLGYTDAFNFNVPSLSKLIFLLTASANPPEMVHSVIDSMEQIQDVDGKDQSQVFEKKVNLAIANGKDTDKPSLGNCEQWDNDRLGSQRSKTESHVGQMDRPATHPQFGCFRSQLLKSLEDRPSRLRSLRVAIADFLYQYKMAVQYPHSFVPYDLQRTAAQLDTQLEPIMSSLNRDIRAYLNFVEDEIAQASREKNASFTSTGVITVHSTSSIQAKSTVETANTFESPSAPTVNDLPTALLDAEKNNPTIAKDNLTGHAASGLLAGLNLSKGRLIRLGRSLDITVTPTEVTDGSAADLEISLSSIDSPADTSSFNSIMDDKSKVDDTDRISKHIVNTTIRVPVLRIFDISTFSASLTRRKTSIPLLPPLLEVPYVGNLFKLPLGTSKAFHRSIVVGAAIIVPTASDIAHSIPFSADRLRESPMQASDANRVAERSRVYHKCLMAYWAKPKFQGSSNRAPEIEECSREQTTLAETPVAPH